MSVQYKESGSLHEVMHKDGFAIHGMMFSVQEVIQCLFLSSKTMYDFYTNDECNCYAITINTTDKWMMATPMNVNNKFNTRCRNHGNLLKSREWNTYSNFDDDHIIILMSKGFVMDNFVMKESYHDFLLKEGEPHVMINASDIESLTVKNPNLE